MTTWAPNTGLATLVSGLGFEYQQDRDLLVSSHHAWQRDVGFTWAYDVMCPSLSMILDCEPIYFDCDGKAWMIELWKGQYGFETGGEIGVYSTAEPIAPLTAAAGLGHDLISGLTAGMFSAAPDVANNLRSFVSKSAGESITFYQCATDDELPMWFRLKRGTEVLFERGPEPHWWLTGFKWGEFTQRPSDLTMDIEITFPGKNNGMLSPFVAALHKPHQIISGRGRPAGEHLTVAFTFDKPRTAQPVTRTPKSDDEVQQKNAVLRDHYVSLKSKLELTTNDPNGFDDRVLKYPELYAAVVGFFTPLQATRTYKQTVAGKHRAHGV